MWEIFCEFIFPFLPGKLQTIILVLILVALVGAVIAIYFIYYA